MNDNAWKLIEEAALTTVKLCPYTVMQSWSMGREELKHFLIVSSLSSKHQMKTIEIINESLLEPKSINKLVKHMKQLLSDSYATSLTSIIRSKLLIDNDVQRINVRKQLRTIWNSSSDEFKDVIRMRLSGKMKYWLDYFEVSNFERNKSYDAKTERYYISRIFEIVFNIYYDDTSTKSSLLSSSNANTFVDVCNNMQVMSISKPCYAEVMEHYFDDQKIDNVEVEFNGHENQAVDVMGSIVQYAKSLKCEIVKDFDDCWIGLEIIKKSKGDNIVVTVSWEDDGDFGTFFVDGEQVNSSSVLDLVSIKLVTVNDLVVS